MLQKTLLFNIDGGKHTDCHIVKIAEIRFPKMQNFGLFAVIKSNKCDRKRIKNNAIWVKAT